MLRSQIGAKEGDRLLTGGWDGDREVLRGLVAFLLLLLGGIGL